MTMLYWAEKSALDHGNPMQDIAYYRLTPAEANRIYNRIRLAIRYVHGD